MLDWCDLLGQVWVPGVIGVVITALVSRFLTGKAWWDQLAGDLKAVIYAGACGLIGLGAWGLGTALKCADWPPLAHAL